MGGPGSGRWGTKGPIARGEPGTYWHHRWVPDIVVLADDARVMPVTLDHKEVAAHPFGCECSGCAAYPVALRGRLKRQHRGVSY